MKDRVGKIKELYLKGFSGVEIADQLDLSWRQVYRLMEQGGIQKRSRTESNSIRFFRKPSTFQVLKKLTTEDKFLWIAGVMLYWAEGTKDPKKQMVEFSNSDPEMNKIFLSFLRHICGVQEDRIRIYLYCYANQNVNKLKSFWSKILKVPVGQFTKPYIRRDFRIDKIDRMPYGMVHMRYSDKKLYLQIESWQNKAIEDFIG